MKNTIYKTIFFIVLIFSALNTFAQQDRNVAWVHGLDGNASSWQHYNQIFDAERNLNSLRTTYTTDIGITNSANQVITSMNTFYGNGNSNSGANDSQNLGIGHSMGGLMIRGVDKITGSGTKKFGGYITVTSPNYGAPISNSILDGSVQSAAANACNKVKDGPIAELLSLPWAISANITTDYLCDIFITNDLVQNLQGTPSTNADLRVGSPTINAINYYTDNNNSSIPRISIWAEENSPVHWRMFSSSVHNNDATLVNDINTARNVYNGFYIYNTAMVGFYASQGFFLWHKVALHTYRATQWKKGRDWIDDSENIWNSLIKTTRSEQETYWALIDVFGNVWDGDNTTGSLGLHWEQRTRWVSVNYPSDGLLPQYTQELQGISSGNRYKVNGANHLEIRNMTTDGNAIDETAVEFRKIFDRDDWFETN